MLARPRLMWIVEPIAINAPPLTVFTMNTFPAGTVGFASDELENPHDDSPIVMAKGAVTADTSLVGTVPVGLMGTGLAVVLSTVTACAAYESDEKRTLKANAKTKQASFTNN
jgi:hypothetical protein